MRVPTYLKSSFRIRSLTVVAALALALLSAEQGFALQTGGSTFRLLTFETGSSGPRLGATRGDGDQDILDVHNAIAYLYRTRLPEARELPAIPIDMRSLIESGDTPIQAVRSLHDTMTRLRDSGSLVEPGGESPRFSSRQWRAVPSSDHEPF